jgi:hypothetical protein
MVIDISKRYSRFRFYVAGSPRQPPNRNVKQPAALGFATATERYADLAAQIKRHRKRWMYTDDYKTIPLFEPRAGTSALQRRPHLAVALRRPDHRPLDAARLIIGA